MTTNVGVLLNLKYQIFVADIITKTRTNGLQWRSFGPNVYQVAICQPAECFTPAEPSISWTIYLSRNQTNSTTGDGYVYYLDVQQDTYPFLSVSSQTVDQVETLYLQVDLLLT
jgi:hypothetical protein